MMWNFHNSIENLLNTLSPSYYKEVPFGPTKLYLDNPSVGSLDFSAVIEFVSATVMSKPELLTYLWDIYNKSAELISFVTSWFKESKRFPVINIIDSFSPVLAINFGSGNVTVSKNVHDVSVKNNDSFRNLAKNVKNRTVERISIDSDLETLDASSFEITRDNCNNFTIPSDTFYDKNYVEVQCDIYRLNTKTGNGRLQLSDTNKNVSFNIISGLYGDYIDALKYPTVLVKAKREIEKNALGEENVKKVFISELLDIIDDGEME